MTNENYYEILGLSKTATDNEIKKQYKKLAKEWHPDKHLANNKIVAEAKFKKISDAYSILSDPEKRKKYDKNEKKEIDIDTDTDMEVEEEVEEEEVSPFTGHHMRREHIIEDKAVDKELTLEQIYSGSKVSQEIERLALCDECDGTGGIDGSDGSDIYCRACRGKGVYSAQLKPGTFTQMPCKTCFGTGKNISKLCKKCNGRKLYHEKVEIEFTVPKGSYEKYPIVVEDEGHALLPEDAAKLDIERTKAVFIVKEKKHPVFKRFTLKEKGKIDYNDLMINIPITFGESILGFNKTIKLLDKKTISFAVSEPCRHDDYFVLKGYGMHHLRDNKKFGDLFVCVKVERLGKLSTDDKKTFCTLLDVSMPPRKKKTDDFKEVITYDEYKIENNLTGDYENLEEEMQKNKLQKKGLPFPGMENGCDQQ
jgi:DnaJ-class molecular chaperone